MSNNEIKFKHASDGMTSTCIGKTIFPALWSLAAVDISTQMKVSEEDGITYDCLTDEDGLKQLISNGNDFLDHVNDANLAISMILTDIKSSEQIQHNLSELVWLQVGLVELAMKVSSSIDKFQDVLKVKNPE
ncbi:MAG: hypothetical protein GQ532_02160 [Methylomarinum sp.]|nr:hypothetical protein [Methylomarinum sp.]